MKIFFSILFVAVSINCFSQVTWKFKNPYPSGNHFNDVFFESEGIGWIAGNAGSVYKTTDTGETWQRLETGCTENLRKIRILSSGTLIAIGDSGTVLTSGDDGTTWNESVLTGKPQLKGIAFTNLGKVYISGRNGVMYSSSDLASWSEINTGVTNDLYGLFFNSASQLWAVGSAGLIMYSTDSGENWNSVNSGVSQTLFSIIMVEHADSAMEGWVSGGSNIFLHSPDGGVTWNQQSHTFGYQASFYDMIYLDRDTLVAVGFYNAVAVNYAGDQWHSRYYINNGFLSLNGVDIAGPSTFIAAGNAGTVLRSTDNGYLWGMIDTTRRENLYDIKMVNSTTGYAVGYTIILKTTDGGNTWFRQEHAADFGYYIYIHGVDFSDTENGWAVCETGVIMRTTDGGANWSSMQSPVTEDLNAVDFVSSLYGWAAGENGVILATTDGGTNWISQTSNTTNYLTDITFVNEYKGWAVGSHGTIVYTTNGGSDWIDLSTSFSDYLTSVSFSDSLNGFTGSASGKIYRTYGGTSWYGGTVEHSGSVSDVYALDESNIWGCGAAGLMVYSSDGGITWHQQNTGTDRNLTSLQFLSSDKGFAAGDFGTVISTSQSPVLSIDNHIGVTAVPKQFTLSQNYPNPFNPVTTIQYTIPTEGYVKVEVFDMLGRKAAGLFNGYKPAGAYTVRFDAGALSSGIYLYSVTFNESSPGPGTRLTGKMILMK